MINPDITKIPPKGIFKTAKKQDEDVMQDSFMQLEQYSHATDGNNYVKVVDKEKQRFNMYTFTELVIVPLVIGMAVGMLLGVYLPMVLENYAMGFRTFDNIFTKAYDRFIERYTMLIEGNFTDSKAIGAPILGISIALYMRWITLKD